VEQFADSVCKIAQLRRVAEVAELSKRRLDFRAQDFSDAVWKISLKVGHGGGRRKNLQEQ